MVLTTQQIRNQGTPLAGERNPPAAPAQRARTRPAGAEARTGSLGRGVLRPDAGDLLGALRDLDVLLTRLPEQADALVQRAWVLRDLGRVHAAAFDFDRAVALAPHDPDVLYNRALFHRPVPSRLGDMSLLAAALRLAPRCAKRPARRLGPLPRPSPPPGTAARCMGRR